METVAQMRLGCVQMCLDVFGCVWMGWRMGVDGNGHEWDEEGRGWVAEGRGCT